MNSNIHKFVSFSTFWVQNSNTMKINYKNQSSNINIVNIFVERKIYNLWLYVFFGKMLVLILVFLNTKKQMLVYEIWYKWWLFARKKKLLNLFMRKYLCYTIIGETLSWGTITLKNQKLGWAHSKMIYSIVSTIEMIK